MVCATMLATLVLTACGKKGEPLPPLSIVPLATTDLALRQQGQFVLFDLPYPTTTVGGLSLGGIDAVELSQLTVPAPEETDDVADGGGDLDVDPREFEAQAEVALTLRGAELAAAISGDRIQFRVPAPGAIADGSEAHVFAIKTFKAGDGSSFSNRVALIPHEPPPAPSGLTLEATADGVRVAWQSDDPSEAFDIFRREANVRGYDEPIARVDGDSRSHIDRSAEFGNRYIYTVRSVTAVEPLVHSDPAGERELEYLDRFPPELPASFVALGERGSVRLRWQASTSDDIAGYLIYRQDPGRDFRPITDEPIADTELLDRGLASGLTFVYKLKTVDQLGNESAFSREASARSR